MRDWLFVRDHCTALNTIFHKGKRGETYVIGGDNERNNIQISQTICTLLDQIKPRQKGTYAELITFVRDRPGHDFRYAIDAKKLKNELGWTPEASFDAGIKQTVTWYLEN